MGYYSHGSAPKGGFLGSVGKALGGVVKGFVSNTPLGMAYNAVSSLTKSPKRVAGPNVQPSDFGTIKGGVLVPTKTDIAKGVVSMLPIGGIINKAFPGALNMGPGASSGSGCPAGYHPAKDGSGRCVRNRQMNYSNGRATNRAVRRVNGTLKQLQRVARAVGKKVVRTGTATRGKKR